MKSLKPLLFVIGCVALCNSAFADQLELTSNIVYGTASDFKGAEQDKPSLKQVQVKINNGDWHDVPMSYSRAPISLNNNDQYAIRVQAADGAWYHTQQLKYSAARDGSSKNLGINGTLTPLKLVQDGVEVARFYNQDDWVGSSMACRHYGNTKKVQCNFDDNFDENAPNKTGSYIGYGSRTDDHLARGSAYLSQEVKPGLEAQANFIYGGSKVGIIVQFMVPGKGGVGRGSMPKAFGTDIYNKGTFTP